MGLHAQSRSRRFTSQPGWLAQALAGWLPTQPDGGLVAFRLAAPDDELVASPGQRVVASGPTWRVGTGAPPVGLCQVRHEGEGLGLGGVVGGPAIGKPAADHVNHPVTGGGSQGLVRAGHVRSAGSGDSASSRQVSVSGS